MQGVKCKYDAKEIMTIISKYFEVPEDEIRGHRRLKEIVRARHFGCYFLHNFTSMTLKTIGILFRIDHSSVIHARDSIKGMLEARSPNEYQHDYRRIYDLITGKIVKDI